MAFLAGRLRRGHLVGVPTETVYGLAADATNAAACRRIFAAKRRPADDPLIVHIASLRDLPRVAVPNAEAVALARRFWPGPLTLVLPKTGLIPSAATAGLPSVAVRMPAHPLFRKLIRLTGAPLAAPSANPFGYVSPTSAEHVRAGLGTRIAHILDGGPSAIGIESTIIDLRDPRRPVLLRPGAVTRAQLERVLRRRVALARAHGGPQVAPGGLARHYSPRTPLVLHRRLALGRARSSVPNEAWLFIGRPSGTPLPPNVFWLDPRGDPERAARNLFATLRDLDAGGFSRIHVERPAAGGIGDAIADRIRRAASR